MEFFISALLRSPVLCLGLGGTVSGFCPGRWFSLSPTTSNCYSSIKRGFGRRNGGERSADKRHSGSVKWFLPNGNMKSGLKKSLKSIMPLRLGWKSNSCFCMLMQVCTAGQTRRNAPVYLNVYDLTPLNGYVYWAGFGIFHSGVEVHGVEYAFGAHDNSTSGVFEVEPRQWPGFRFRKSIFMGTTCLDPIQAREFMENHSVNYNGDTYHLIVKNCNHFTKDVCRKLTGNSIPKWVNRLAKIGRLCSCLLPEALRVSASRNDPDSADGEKRRLRSSFSCLPSISVRQKVLSSSFLFLPSPLKSCLPPLELRKSGPFPLRRDHEID